MRLSSEVWVIWRLRGFRGFRFGLRMQAAATQFVVYVARGMRHDLPVVRYQPIATLSSPRCINNFNNKNQPAVCKRFMYTTLVPGSSNPEEQTIVVGARRPLVKRRDTGAERWHWKPGEGLVTQEGTALDLESL